MNFYDILQVLVCSALAALWLTIFYKKNFDIDRHFKCRVWSIFVLIPAWGLVYLCGAHCKVLYTVVIAFGTLVYVCIELQTLVIEEKGKCVVLGASLVCVYFFQAKYLACGAAVCALSQLLRWPLQWKNKLREFRIVLGPAYTIFIVGSCIQSVPSSTLLTFASILALLASILLRPDNNEVLRLLEHQFGLPIPSSQCRKMTHGLCMFISFVLCTSYIYITDDLDSRVFYVIMSIAVLNTCMYLFVADLPARIVTLLRTR